VRSRESTTLGFAIVRYVALATLRIFEKSNMSPIVVILCTHINTHSLTSLPINPESYGWDL
jgi:hypothetical protein